MPASGGGTQRLLRLEAQAEGTAAGPRQAENALITADIQAVFQEHRGFYGSPHIH